MFIRYQKTIQQTSNMEAITNVEVEVDNVLRLFSNYRGVCESEIDKAVEFIERSKREINELARRKYNCSHR